MAYTVGIHSSHTTRKGIDIHACDEEGPIFLTILKLQRNKGPSILCDPNQKI